MHDLALYRKYRPQSFKEVVGQDHIVKVLESSVETNKVSHAYLFVGSRGIGKTSVAIDGTAPTLSSSTPADDATGASATTLVLTFSKSMDPATINDKNIAVVAAAEASVGTLVAITNIVMSVNDTVATITYALGGTTEYEVVLGKGLKDAAGNAYAGSKISFTTT